MKLGLGLIQTAFSAQPAIDLDTVSKVEALGYHSVWAAEAYGCDAVSSAALARGPHQSHQGWHRHHADTCPLTCSWRPWPLSVWTRCPAVASFLGLGSSGPQVSEGWHGVSYHKPLTRAREYVEIVRKILARDEPVTYHGTHFQLPMSGDDCTGLGKPLKSVAHTNAEQPIFMASISPGGLRLAAQIADGVLLSFLDPDDTQDIVDRHLAEGFAMDGARNTRDTFTVSTFINVFVHDDEQEVMRMIQPQMARQLGGMGAKSKNFYAEFARRMGYNDEVEQIQQLYLAGEKEKAATAVPLDLIDRTNLIGSRDRIRERLTRWKAAQARGALDMMLITSQQTEALELMAEELL